MKSGSSPRTAISNLGLQLGVCFLLSLAPALPAQTTVEWVYHKTADGLHPDGNEQQLVWLMNRARANPAAEGQFLTNSGDSGINSGISFFQISPAQIQSEFAATAAKPPAAFDRRLYEASRIHSLDLIAREAQDHDNQFTRITTAGFAWTSANASVFSYSKSALEAHGALNIDWGYPRPPSGDGMQAGRGHRAAIMSNQSTLLTNVGFALVPETNPATDVGPLVFSGAYCSASSSAANHSNRFLIGTVWTDLNANNRYDPGEGRNNVRVQPDSGPWHAITGIAGGWAIPIATPATYTLTFSGASLINPLMRTATVSTSSVLADVKVTPSALPFTLGVRLGSGGQLILNWTGGTPPYQVQRSTSLSSNSWTNVGTTTSATTLTVTLGGLRGFYRILGSP